MKMLLKTLGFLSAFLPAFSQAQFSPLRNLLYQINYQVQNGADLNLSGKQQSEAEQNLTNVLNLLNGTSPTELLCVVSSHHSSYYRLYNGKKEISNDSLPDECQSLIHQTKNKLVCGRSFEHSSYFNIYNIESGLAIGRYSLLTDCQKLVQESTPHYVCSVSTNHSSYFSLYKVSTGERVGGDLSMDDCLQSLPGH